MNKPSAPKEAEVEEHDVSHFYASYSENASRRTLGSDLKRVDAHTVKPSEYKELPELTDEMLARSVAKKGGRLHSPNPRQLISLRLPAEVIERWRATGPGWQTRMAERLAKAPALSDKNLTRRPADRCAAAELNLQGLPFEARVFAFKDSVHGLPLRVSR